MPSILEQGNEILAGQSDDTLKAGVTRDGAQVAVKKSVGRGWSIFAWWQRLWSGPQSAGAGVEKKL